MRLPLALALIVFIAQIGVDFYLLNIARKRCRSPRVAKFQLWEGAFFLAYISVFLCMPKRDASNTLLQIQMWMLFAYVAVYLSKTVFILFDLLASLPALWKRCRYRSLSWFGAALGLITFVGMWWGALANRHRIQVCDVEVEITGLPESFDGYRIAQISDLHVGTYGNDTAFIHDLVEKVNSLNPNLVVFTGDIVNRTTSELVPFVRPLSRLSAPDGVISILGNHDYGDYYNWPSQNAKEQNLEWLLDLQIEMGWELLTNSSTVIYGQSASDSLVIVGVENWGDPPFPTYGDLNQAYSTPGDSVAKILLTHNPAHWISCIAPVDTMKFGLTLSGHTHAMQMEIAGFSPAVWRYRTWGGLYQTEDNERPLYVNIGAGTVGVPMRLGATPEITLFTITPRKNNK